MNRTTALITAGALVAAPLATLLAASPASADTTKRGVCGHGSYEFQVDREDREDGGGFEVSADLDRLAPGSSWTVVIKHDGKRVSKVTRTADSGGRDRRRREPARTPAARTPSASRRSRPAAARSAPPPSRVS